MGQGKHSDATTAGAGVGATASVDPPAAETVRTETRLDAGAAHVWAAVRDVYEVHERLVPGMVVSVERDGDTRKVTFANGFVVNERIIAIDDAEQRIIYSAFGGRATHHMASMQVITEGSGSRVIWITEFLPSDLRPLIVGNMEQGSLVMKKTLEAQAKVAASAT